MLDIFEEISRMRAEGGRGALATVIATRGSTPGRETMRLLVRESGSFLGTVGGGCVEAEVVAAAREVIEDDKPRRVRFRLTEAETGTSTPYTDPGQNHNPDNPQTGGNNYH